MPAPTWLFLLLAVACGDAEEGTNRGDCTDGVDNDGDGAVDCDDDGCAGTIYCVDDGGGTTDTDGGGTTDTDGGGEDSGATDTDTDGGGEDSGDAPQVCDENSLAGTYSDTSVAVASAAWELVGEDSVRLFALLDAGDGDACEAILANEGLDGLGFVAIQVDRAEDGATIDIVGIDESEDGDQRVLLELVAPGVGAGPASDGALTVGTVEAGAAVTLSDIAATFALDDGNVVGSMEGAVTACYCPGLHDVTRAEKGGD